MLIVLNYLNMHVSALGLARQPTMNVGEVAISWDRPANM